LQEPVASPDISELKDSSERVGSSELFKPEAPVSIEAEGTAAGPVRKTLVLSARLGQVGLSVSRGTGTDVSGGSTTMANFSMNMMSANLSMLSDGSLDLKFSMKELVMEDTRSNSTNLYKKVKIIVVTSCCLHL
jgi:hypothetical protein